MEQGLTHDREAVVSVECLTAAFLVCSTADRLVARLPAILSSPKLPPLERVAKVAIECLRGSLRGNAPASAAALEVVARIASTGEDAKACVALELQRLSLEGILVEALESWSKAVRENVEIDLLFDFFELVLEHVHFADLIGSTIPSFIVNLSQRSSRFLDQEQVLRRALDLCLCFPDPHEVHCLFKRASDKVLEVRIAKGLVGVRAIEGILRKRESGSALNLRAHEDWLSDAILRNSVCGVKNPSVLQSLGSLVIAAGAAEKLLHFVSETLGVAESSNVLLCEVALHGLARSDSRLVNRLREELGVPMKTRDGTGAELHKKVLAQVSLAFLGSRDDHDEFSAEETLRELARSPPGSATHGTDFDSVVHCLDMLHCTVLSALANEWKVDYNVKSIVGGSASDAGDDAMSHLCMAQDILVRALNISNDSENRGSCTSLHRLCEHAKALHKHHTRATQSYHKQGGGVLSRHCFQAISAISIFQCSRADLWFPAVAQALSMPIDGSGFHEDGNISFGEGDTDFSMYEFNSVMTLSIQNLFELLRAASQAAFILVSGVSNQVPATSRDFFAQMLLTAADVPSLVGSYSAPLVPPVETLSSGCGLRSSLDVALESGLAKALGTAFLEGRFLAMVKTHSESDGRKHLLLSGSHMLDIMLSISWSTLSLHGPSGLASLAAQFMNKGDKARPAANEFIARMEHTLNDILASCTSTCHIVIAAGLLEVCALYANALKLSHSESLLRMSLDIASKARRLQIDDSPAGDLKICLAAARSWQAITSCRMRCYQLDKVGPSWGTIKGEDKVRTRVRRVLNEVAAHCQIVALKELSKPDDYSLGTRSARLCTNAILEMSKVCKPWDWNPDLCLDGICQYLQKRLASLIKALDVEQLCLHCEELTQIVKARSCARLFTHARSIPYPLATGKAEVGGELNLSRCHEILPLSVGIESILSTLAILLASSLKFKEDSWRVLASAGEVAIEVARIVQTLCKDMDFMFSGVSSSVMISDAMVCLRKCNVLILRRLNKWEDMTSRNTQPFGGPTLQLKTRLNEMANQIQYIVGNMKPLSRKKAEEVVTEKKVEVAPSNSESETEDLEPSLSSEGEDGEDVPQDDQDGEESSSEDDFRFCTAK